MKRVVGLVLGLFLAISAADVSPGEMLAEFDASAETDGLAGEPDVEGDEDADPIVQGLAEGHLLTCGVTGQQRLAAEIGSAEQGHATEIHFPPWG